MPEYYGDISIGYRGPTIITVSQTQLFYDGYHYCWLDIQNDHNYYIQIYSFIIAKKPRIGTRKYHHNFIMVRYPSLLYNYGHYV